MPQVAQQRGSLPIRGIVGNMSRISVSSSSETLALSRYALRRLASTVSQPALTGAASQRLFEQRQRIVQNVQYFSSRVSSVGIGSVTVDLCPNDITAVLTAAYIRRFVVIRSITGNIELRQQLIVVGNVHVQVALRSSVADSVLLGMRLGFISRRKLDRPIHVGRAGIKTACSPGRHVGRFGDMVSRNAAFAPAIGNVGV